MTDGSHFISAGIEIIDANSTAQFGYGARSQSFEIVVDTGIPPVFFGDPAITTDGLDPNSDSGVLGSGNQATFTDRITNDVTPTFWGQAEANSIIKVYVDLDSNNIISPADVLIGQTVASPLDGTNQEPFGRWELTSTVSMNDANRILNVAGFSLDGQRTILVSSEDLSGNVNPAVAANVQMLQIFIDTQGPQVFDPDTAAGPNQAIQVITNGVPNPTFNLFNNNQFCFDLNRDFNFDDLKGDFDEDNDVDGADFLAWQRGYGMSAQPSMADGDGNDDGSVDHDDRQLWSSAFGAGRFAAADWNNDGWVDGSDLATLEGEFGGGQVNGSDFLDWQRQYVAAPIAALSVAAAPVAPSPPLTALELFVLSSAYGESLAPAAKEAAFAALDEAAAGDSVADGRQALAVARRAVFRTSSSEVEPLSSAASSHDADAWELAFSEEDELLLASLF